MNGTICCCCWMFQKNPRRTFALSCSLRPAHGKKVEEIVKNINEVDSVEIYIIDGEIMEVKISGTVHPHTVIKELKEKYKDREVKIVGPNQPAGRPGKSVGMKTFDWCPNQNHRLMLLTNAKRFACDECKEDGFGSRYRCGQCVHELHVECTFPETIIDSKLLEGHENLKLHPRPEKGGGSAAMCCDACGKEICGYSYRCEEKYLNFHPRCSNLVAQISIGGGDSGIDRTVFNICFGKLSKCMWCKKKRNSGTRTQIPGSYYVSDCKEYKLHVNCIIEMAHEAWKKHDICGTDVLEAVDLKAIDKSNRNGGKARRSKAVKILEVLLDIIYSVLFGDSTPLFWSVIEPLLIQN